MTFGQTSTAAEVVDGIDLSDRVAVVTGASGGIGLETARALASAGATVVLGNRASAKSTAAADSIRAGMPAAGVEARDLDLTSLGSVRAFAEQVLAEHERIDILVNNAGVMATPLERTAEGFELQLGTNHLGHFLLTNLLTPAMQAGTRIVSVSSLGHVLSPIQWIDPNYEQRDYQPWEAYGQSKTATILFSMELDRRLGARGVHAFSVHPGVVATDLFRYMQPAEADAIKEQSGHLVKTPEQGAATTVYAATAASLADHGGAFLGDCEMATPAPHATSAEDAQRLWRLSETLVAETF